jgi:hypothetical protein
MTDTNGNGIMCFARRQLSGFAASKAFKEKCKVEKDCALLTCQLVSVGRPVICMR